MSSPQTIFIVEDDELYIELYTEVLGEEFNLISYTSAAEALKHYKTHLPKTIILDLNMPEMNGIEFCQALFDGHCTENEVDIIFVSGESDNEVKLSAFEAGAADFICKPFELKELVYKVRSSISRKTKEQSLAQEASESKQLVYTTMAQASQYSQVMSFFKSLNSCGDLYSVAQAFFTTMSYFNLNTSIKFKVPSLSFFNANGLEVSPIEKEVYQVLEASGRVYQFSKRLIINDQHVSFIIKNLPDNDDEIGQIRDYTASMIEGLEAKVLDLYSRHSMDNAVLQLSSNIEGLKTNIRHHSATVGAVMSNMMAEIASSFHSLEMTEQQEQFLNQLIENSSNELKGAEGSLVEVMTELESLKSQMERVQQEVKVMEEPEAVDDIELF